MKSTRRCRCDGSLTFRDVLCTFHCDYVVRGSERYALNVNISSRGLMNSYDHLNIILFIFKLEIDEVTPSPCARSLFQKVRFNDQNLGGLDE